MTYIHDPKAALARAEKLLADAEVSLAAGNDSYAEQNLKSARARVERLRAEASTTGAIAHPAPVVAAPPATPAPAPAPKAPTAPVITGTREERLRRIAAAFGTDERTLEAAIDDGISPDEFAMIASNEALAAAKAKEILAA
jgi:hypothetical protein